MQNVTTERAMLVIVFALLLAMATRIPVDTDTWWHLRSAEYTLTRGMIYTDPFSHTMQGEAWINHSWGAQLVLYAAWQIGGNVGLALYTALLATGGMVFVYLCCAGNSYLRAFALIACAATAAVFWSARPQMLSFFLSTVILYLLHLHKREGKDRLWLIPPIMALWGNLHAGFSIGFIFLLGSIAGEMLGTLFKRRDAEPPDHTLTWGAIRKLLLITVVSAAALVINPYGLNMLSVPFQTVSIGALRDYIQEWNSPNFHGRETWPFIFLLLGVFGAAGASKRRLDWTDFVLVSGTTFMALLAGRNISVFAVVAAPVLTYHLDSILTERGWTVRPVRRAAPRMARLNALLVIATIIGVAAMIAATLNPARIREEQERFLPLRAVEYLNSHTLPETMFNSYNWGGYLMFAAPQHPVFVDGRTDLYGDDFLTRWYNTIMGFPGWQDTLNTYNVRLVVIENGTVLSYQLREDEAWSLAYEDSQAVIFTRETLP